MFDVNGYISSRHFDNWRIPKILNKNFFKFQMLRVNIALSKQRCLQIVDSVKKEFPVTRLNMKKTLIENLIDADGNYYLNFTI